MKIWTLLENTTQREDLLCEHGLSLYIETDTHRILFDAGQTDAFARNAEKMGIDLSMVDIAVLSHGHYDHSGGLIRFLEINPTAPIYMSRHAFGQHFNGANKYIGIDPNLSRSSRIRLVEDRCCLGYGMELLCAGQQRCFYPIEPFGLNRMEAGKRIPEDFRHEQYLLLREGEKTVLFSGCSHKGILNIAQWYQPDVLIGGFHYAKCSPDSPFLRQAAQTLLQQDTVYYTGHCTGPEQYWAMKAIMGERLNYLSTGAFIAL